MEIKEMFKTFKKELEESKLREIRFYDKMITKIEEMEKSYDDVMEY